MFFTVEVLRSQQTEMKANLAKVPPGSPIYDKIKAIIEKVEIACKEIEENSFGFINNGALENAGWSDLKNPLVDALTSFTEGIGHNVTVKY